MKKVIIIGATSGIGRELARIYSRNGYETGLAGRRSELLNSLASELNCRTYLMPMDITDTDQAVKSLETLIENMQGTDIIIISAGTGSLNESLEWDKEKETIDTNVSGFTAIADFAIRYFTNKGSGHLVGISSIASNRGSGIAPAYNASKSYISNYLEGLRINVYKKKLPVTVTDIQPGLVNTAMAKGEGLFWVASPEKAAAQIYKAVQKKKKKACVTRRWAIIAFLYKIMPDYIYKRL